MKFKSFSAATVGVAAVGALALTAPASAAPLNASPSAPSTPTSADPSQSAGPAVRAPDCVIAVVHNRFVYTLPRRDEQSLQST
jgi:hypothetical protein